MANLTIHMTCNEVAKLVENHLRDKLGPGLCNFRTALDATTNGGWTGFVVTCEEMPLIAADSGTPITLKPWLFPGTNREVPAPIPAAVSESGV